MKHNYLTLFLLILISGINEAHAQDYRLVTATNYRSGVIEDSVYLRFSWNRSVDARSLVYLQTPYIQTDLYYEKYDTFYHFINGDMLNPAAYIFSEYDLYSQLRNKTYNNYLKERVEGYNTDTVRRIGKQVQMGTQQWVDKIKNETISYADRKIEIRYEMNGGIWHPTTRWERINVADGDSVIINYINPPQTPDWQYISTETHHFDANGQLIFRGVYPSDSRHDIYSYTYHPNGELKEYRLDEYHHDTMKTRLRQTSSLNANQEIDSIHIYYYNENQISSHFIAIASYDGQNRIRQLIGEIDPMYPNTLYMFDSLNLEYLNTTKYITAFKHFFSGTTFAAYYTYEPFNNNVGLATTTAPISPSVYPNPSAHQLNIDWPKNDGVISFRLYDGQGKELFSKKLDKSDHVIYIPESITAGLYYYRLQSGAAHHSGKLQLLP